MFSYFAKDNNLSHLDIPYVDCISDVESYGIIVDTASLLWHEDAETEEEAIRLNIEELKITKSSVLLWATDLTLLKLRQRTRGKLLQQCSGIMAGNEYIASLLKVFYLPPIYLLRHPISDIKYCYSKRRTVVAAGTVGISNDTPIIIELFQGLSDEWDKIYIGRSNTVEDRYLEGGLKNTCDWYADIDQKRFQDVIDKAYIHVHIDKHDINPINFIRFGLSGSHILVSNKLTLFNEYPHINRFDSVSQCVHIIEEIFKNEGSYGNERISTYMRLRHSTDAFKDTLQKIIWEVE